VRTILLSTLVVAGVAGFLVPTTSRAVDDACAAEVDKFCGDVVVGQFRVVECLKLHSSKFTPSCRTQIQAQAKEINAELKKVGEACKSDIDKFCAKVQPGGGRIARCLEDNSGSLSLRCVSSLKR
jgi:hypothetical protein